MIRRCGICGCTSIEPSVADNGLERSWSDQLDVCSWCINLKHIRGLDEDTKDSPEFLEAIYSLVLEGCSIDAISLQQLTSRRNMLAKLKNTEESTKTGESSQSLGGFSSQKKEPSSIEKSASKPSRSLFPVCNTGGPINPACDDAAAAVLDDGFEGHVHALGGVINDMSLAGRFPSGQLGHNVGRIRNATNSYSDKVAVRNWTGTFKPATVKSLRRRLQKHSEAVEMQIDTDLKIGYKQLGERLGALIDGHRVFEIRRSFHLIYSSCFFSFVSFLCDETK